jgi:1,4-alpha-glucan branching enzyme
MSLDGPGSDEVRRFLCDNALMWFRDYHLDGLRLGAVHALIDTSATSFLEQLAEAIRDGRRREFAAFGWDPNVVPDPQAPETFAPDAVAILAPERT